MNAERIKKSICLLAVILILFGNTVVDAEADGGTVALLGSPVSGTTASDYYDYYRSNSSEMLIREPLVIRGDELSGCEISELALSETEGRSAAVISDNGNRWAEWRIKVPENGIYSVELTYCALEGSGKDIIFSLWLDGGLPFSEADELMVRRLWQDGNGSGEAVKTDSYGNDLLPKQTEIKVFSSVQLADLTGLYSEPYLFRLTAGEHTLRLGVKQEAMAISEITLGSRETASYKDYISKYGESDKSGKGTYYIQAEQPIRKNKPTLYPQTDRTTTATVPYDAAHTKLNTIGKTSWASNGEYITWRANVPEKGLYRVLFRARQSYNEGMNSYRSLFVNGMLPFKEAQAVCFPYATDWYGIVLGGSEEYSVYIKPGDEITLQVTTGPMSSVLRSVQEATYMLNELYRKIIVITGTAPDAFRDYSLESKIDSLTEDIGSTRAMLEEATVSVRGLIGEKGSQASAIDRVIAILKNFEEKPYDITAKLSSFKDSIETLGSLVQTLGSQPLELDYIALVPVGEKLPSTSAGWFDDLKYNISKFFISFIYDYDSLGSSGTSGSKKALDVWVSTGRDQAQVINSMITDDFTYNSGTRVNLSMVSTSGILIQATLAGKGPHLALLVAHGEPVNLAMRGALVDLSDKKYSLDSIQEEFFASSWTPFEYNGGMYAMPETQTFDMLFYRKDIFEKLSLTPPDTWDDFYILLRTLQENNLLFGIPEINSANAGVSAGISTFDMFLFQNGGQYYNEKKDSTLFCTEVAFDAFESWVRLYSRYGLDREFDFYNRFRSGEMPAGIQPYTMYNKLTAAAPEIRGLWDFTVIPGTVAEDGSVSHAESSNGSGCIMLNRAVEDGVDSEGFEFLKWWVGADAQARYCQELEAMMGSAARGTPANVSAFKRLNWTKAETETILSQWEYICNPPQIPGNYTVARSLTNAFRAALGDNQNARRYLQIYNKDINQEIKRKRKEFKLDGRDGAQ